MTRSGKMRKSEVEFFGKTYKWVEVDGQLQLRPDLQFDLLFPMSAGRTYGAYLKNGNLPTGLRNQQLDYYRRLAGLTK